ncbi:hypothetical protein [Actinoplanes sp. URMC 104]|uniref:hypothetical protein n=1 Tax=Actinoplanes sp. URMC 104 TaxID=3423409 RepID=UPI003F1B28DB
MSSAPARWTLRAVAGLLFWVVVVAAALLFIPRLGDGLLWLLESAVTVIGWVAAAVAGVLMAFLLIGFGKKTR